MIRTSRHLKDMVRKMSGSDSAKAQIIIRNYIMERFLERLSISKYRNHLILKGGILVSAIVGLDNRSTMDVDTTFKNYPLSLETVTETINEIIAIPVDDGVSFQIKSVDNILDESEYGGIRAILEATLETMRTQLKLDITTGDVITPHEISYDFKLMFEERTISILAYNLETVLAEKLETVISRQIANTRMRDFYDLYILQNYQSHNIDMRLLSKALKNTTHKRESEIAMQNSVAILADIQKSSDMKKLWGNYGQKFDYAKDITWDSVIESIKTLLDNINVNPHTS